MVVKERLVLESGCIVVTFETGAGSNTTPVLLLETDVDLQMFDWSTKVSLDFILIFCIILNFETSYVCFL